MLLRRRGVLGAVLCVALLIGACGKSRPEPTMDFTVEQTGEGITIRVETTNFSVPEDGHIHIWIDDGPETMAFQYTYTVPKLPPGVHRVTVDLSDHRHVNLGLKKTKEIEVRA
ncbi:MAG TPA: hypothetical protein VIL07_07430, partial [Symbiobacteriaceae bacterium]